MNVPKIVTRKGNCYIYSERYKNFHLLPQPLQSYLEGHTPSDPSDYYWKKYQFWKNTILKEAETEGITPVLVPDAIKNSLANLRQLVLEVTDGCNLKCLYCGFGSLYTHYDPRLNKKLTFTKVKTLIDYLVSLWQSPTHISYNIVSVGFYGGEPLLNFKLIQQTISYLEELDLKNTRFTYTMTTNGMLLDKYMDYLAEKNFLLLISLDGDKNNNSYRTTKSDRSSFDTVLAHTLALQNKYPVYFEKNVNFNAVLHDRNSVEEIYNFIKETFNKIPKISELNPAHVRPEKKKEFAKLFRVQEIYPEHLQTSSPSTPVNLSKSDILVYKKFFDSCCGNNYLYVCDLLENESHTYPPTGTCYPFEKKLLLTVNGKLFPCEKISHLYPLGEVDHNGVQLDFEKIKEMYTGFYTKIADTCHQCLLQKNCGECIYFLEEKEGKFICRSHLPRSKASRYYSDFLSCSEENPVLYSQINTHLIPD